MTPEPDKQLEQAIHRELRKLPELSAPADLIPRVRAAIEVRARLPWWKKSWFNWPLPARVISGVAAFATVVLLASFSPGLWSATTASASRLGETMLGLSPALDAMSALASAMVAVVRSVNSTYLLIGFGVVAMMYAACIAAGTACFRIAWNKR